MSGFGQCPIDPAGDLPTVDLPLPLGVRRGIESPPRLLRGGESHQLGDRLGITRDDDLALDLKERLGRGPPLAQVSDAERFHTAKYNMFHIAGPTGS